MRTNHVFTLTAVLLAGLAFGSVNTASADRGDNDRRRDNNSYRHDNDRRDNDRRDFGRNDRGRDRDRHDYRGHDRGNDKTTVIIKKDRDRWNVGDALLYHFGKTVINEVFEHPRQTTVIVTGHYDYVWVAPVYEYRRDHCGNLVKICVREGFYKKVWIPATTSCETGYH